MSAPASTNPAAGAAVTPSRAAREAAGLTLEQAAKLGRLSVDYLRRCERRQDFPLILASRLAAVYSAPLSSFWGGRPGVRGAHGAAVPGGGRRPQAKSKTTGETP
jgi:hypothetical protein